MKKLLVILFSVGLALGASAQRSGHLSHGGGYVYRPHVIVGMGLGYGYGYGPFSPYYGWYDPWGFGYPPPYFRYAVPSRLALQIDGINNDYRKQIRDVRQDKTLPRKERRARIRQLKHDRDQALIQARKDFYYSSKKRDDRIKSNDDNK